MSVKVFIVNVTTCFTYENIVNAACVCVCVCVCMCINAFLYLCGDILSENYCSEAIVCCSSQFQRSV